MLSKKPILALGTALTPQITWKLQISTRPWNPREAPRPIRVYTQEQPQHLSSPLLFKVFQPDPSHPVCLCPGPANSLGQAALPPSMAIQLGRTGGTLQEFQKLVTPRACPVSAGDPEGLCEFAFPLTFSF